MSEKLEDTKGVIRNEDKSNTSIQHTKTEKNNSTHKNRNNCFAVWWPHWIVASE